MTARFTPDGARLFVLSDPTSRGRAGLRTSVAGSAGRSIPPLWRQRACTLVGGGLTPEEWEEIAPEHDYISVCPSG